MADLLGRPVGLVLCDLNAPMVVDLDKLESKPCNALLDGRAGAPRALDKLNQNVKMERLQGAFDR